MKFLNREASPLSSEIWARIDNEFSSLLSKRLKMRSVVDFSTVPFETDAISTGSLAPVDSNSDVALSVRTPLKMVELNYDFEMPKSVIEELKRDKPDFDDTVFKKVTNTFSKVENGLILTGEESANIVGILSDIPHEPIKAGSTQGLIDAVSQMLGKFAGEFVDGPFKLVLSTATLIKITGESEGDVSVKSRLENLLGTDFFIVCESIGDDKILALSQKGEDFIFYNGLDVSIGYRGETENAYQLFLMECCTFRVVGSESALLITL